MLQNNETGGKTDNDANKYRITTERLNDIKQKYFSNTRVFNLIF